MPVFDVNQESLIGNIVMFPISLLRMIGHTIIVLLSLPFRLLRFILSLPVRIFRFLSPVFYEESIGHTFKTLLCTAKTGFLILSSALILILIPGYLLMLFVSHVILRSSVPFDLGNALMGLGAALTGTELLILVLAAAGFLISFLLAFVFITIYSPALAIGEIVHAMTSNKIVLILMFFLTVVVIGVLYMILSTGFVPQ